VRLPADEHPEVLDAPTRALIERVRPFTMTSSERLTALRQAMHYVSRYGIPGDFVECGVWRGGSSMMAALALLELGDTTRHLYLFDTFEGMSVPTSADCDSEGRSAAELLANSDRTDPIWAYAPMEDVRVNIATTGYPQDQVHLIRGRVEETIPGDAPDQISVLRLDTDWYESTRHELEHLVGRLSPNGVLIIDDYGHWHGARKAVDEWLEKYHRPILLHRIDYTGRIAVMPGPGPSQAPSAQ